MTASGMEQPEVSDEAIHSIVTILLGWFEAEGRQFIWRKTTNPFTVLIAEILLRKTQADVIEQFLPSFIAKYPASAALASASIEELTIALSPVGLSTQRANQLHEMAQLLVREYRGEIPAQSADLRLLPGVGRYTAGIVASTSFSCPVAAVDTNIARIICRVFGLKPSHAEARKSANVWSMAESLAQQAGQHAARLTWAMLDLGATVCIARKPKCDTCPLREQCVSAMTSAIEDADSISTK